MKTNKGFASVLIILAVIAIVGISASSYYLGKKSNKPQPTIKEVQTPEVENNKFPTVSEVEARPEFKGLQVGIGQGVINNNNVTNLGLEEYGPSSVDLYTNFFFILRQLKNGGEREGERSAQLVYDILKIQPYSSCTSCHSKGIDLYWASSCFYKQGVNQTTALAVTGSDGKIYQAWSINTDLLKFQNISDLKDVSCYNDEEGVE